jgi:WD40 repeat protein
LTATAPYPGLRPFRADEFDVFFGREEQIDQLLERLDRARLLAVVGPSGSGKSSLVKAGLIPALQTGFLASAGARWRVAEMRPGNHPLRRLAEALLADSALGPERAGQPSAVGFLLATLRRGPLGLAEVLADTPPPAGTRLLLVVDQFEEIFRFLQLGDEEEAEAFVALLLAAAEQAQGPIYVVLTMRSDFLGDCAQFQGLPEALNDSQFLTPRMRREERRRAIEGPAGVFGARVEPALTNRLLNDMGDDPDQLPRAQHLLMRLWNRCGGRTGDGGVTLTVADYEAVGGFADALSRHADEAFEGLDEEGRHIAEHLFRALCERGDDQRDTRRPVPLAEVAAVAGVEPQQVAAVVEEFRHPDRSFLTPAAGVALGPETVLDITHESLIRQWPRLRGWVEQEASSAETYRRLAETARLWKAGRAGLWGPPDLDVALAWNQRQHATAAWAERYGGDLEVAMEFLAASREKRRQDEEAQERARADAAEQRRVRQRNRLLSGGLVVAAALLLVAFIQWRRADRQRNLARQQTLLARAGELVARAREVRDDRPQTSLLLAAEALALEQQAKAVEPQAVHALQEGLGAASGQTLPGQQGEAGSLVISPHGHWLATASPDGPARLWDLDSSQPAAPRLLGDPGTAVPALALGPDGRWLATGRADGTAQLWDLATPDPAAHPRVFAGRSVHARGMGHSRLPLTAVAISRSRWLATGRADGTAQLWDLAAPDPVAPQDLGQHADVVTSIAASPDGRWLATASADNTAALWDLAAPDPGRTRIPLNGHRGPVAVARFTPDGRFLATAAYDNTVRLWDLADPGASPLVLCGHNGSVVALEISDDSRWLITGSSDATARIWDLPALTAGARRLRPGRRHPVVAAALSPSSCVHLLTDDPHHPGVMWDLRDLEPAVSGVLVGHRDTVTALAVSPLPPGSLVRFLATASRDHTVRLWSLTAEDAGRTSMVLRGHDREVRAVAFHPLRHAVFSGSADATVRRWDLRFRQQTLVSQVFSGPLDAVTAVALTADGRSLVAGSDDNNAYVWDLTHRGRPLLLRGHDSSISGIGLSPDSRWLATASQDNTIRLWDLSVLPADLQSRVLRGNASSVTSLAFTPDNRWLATAGRDGTARIWSLEVADPAAAPTVLCGHTGAVVDLAASADGRWLATVGEKGTARLWDLDLLRPLLPGASRPAPLLAAALDEQTCRRQTVSGESLDTRALEPAASRLLQAGGDGARITAVAFVAAPGGGVRWLATGDSQGAIALWDLGAGTDGEPLRFRGQEGPVTRMAVSADGRWLATAGTSDTASLVDLAADPGSRMLVLRDHRDRVMALAFSPDGRWLATGSADGEARLWDLAAEDPSQAPGVLYGHQGAVTSLVFSHDGNWLATGSRDHTARVWSTYLWSLDPERLVDLACQVAGRDLTRGEWEDYLPGLPYHRTCFDRSQHGEQRPRRPD